MTLSQPESPGRSSSVPKKIGLIAGLLILLVLVQIPPPEGMSVQAWRTAATALLMAIWWITEAVPIPVTSLAPLVLFPLLNVLPITEAAAPYANPVIFLFMGGFMIAAALESCGLHLKMALSIILVVGARPANLIGGFMLATAFLSMWVSNTATVAMMLPVALSIVALAEQEKSNEEKSDSRLSVALLLGIAYAASIGGIGTLIGTPPNALLAGFMASTYGVHIGFAQWMLVGVPPVVIALPLCWLLLVRVLSPVDGGEIVGGREIIHRELAALGPMSRTQITVGAITLLVASAWVLQPLLERFIPGITDAGIAIGGALLLFLVPVDWRRFKFALHWRQAERLPWGVLILFGGGLSLANAIQQTGLAGWIGGVFGGFTTMPILVVSLVVTTVIVFLTELTSNTATAAAFLPIVASLAAAMGHDPLLLALPTVLAASCAFMMPVATPPNAIIFGSGRVTIRQMARAGLWLNFLMIVVINLLTFGLARFVFGI